MSKALSLDFRTRVLAAVAEGMRGELRLHIARGAEGRVVEHGQILAHGARCGLGVDRLWSPVLLRRRVLLVGIRLDQAGIDGEALSADQALGDAPGDDRLEEMPKEVARAKAAMPVLGEGRVVKHPTGQIKPAELLNLPLVGLW